MFPAPGAEKAMPLGHGVSIDASVWVFIKEGRCRLAIPEDPTDGGLGGVEDLGHIGLPVAFV